MTRARWLLASAVVVLALLAGWLLWPEARATVGSAPVPSSPPTTVIVIPGYGGSMEPFRPIEKDLAAQGVRVLELPTGDGHGDLNLYAESLRQATRNAGGPVAWVAFSAGGLIARAAYTPDMYPLVTSVTTWGSPHKGTMAAAAGALFGQCDTACQQMRPDSPFLSGLPPLPTDGARWVSLYSPNDQVITPYQNSMVNGAHNLDLGSCGVTPIHSELGNDFVVRTVTVKNVLGQGVGCP